MCFWLNVKALASILLLLLACCGPPVTGRKIDNGVDQSSAPQIYCFRNGLKFRLNTRNPFNGHLYVKGMYGNPQCNHRYFGDTTAVSLSVAYEDCVHKRERMVDPSGMIFTLELVIQFHPFFTTSADRGFLITCSYMEDGNTVTSDQFLRGNINGDGDEIPLLTPQYSQQTPKCHYSIHRGSPTGPHITFAKVGEMTFHKWQCYPTEDGEFNGILVHSCYARSGSISIKLLDKRGCTLDPFAMATPGYTSNLTMAFVEVHAFKFADNLQISFSCSISMCLRANNRCAGITPPSCMDSQQLPPGDHALPAPYGGTRGQQGGSGAPSSTGKNQAAGGAHSYSGHQGSTGGQFTGSRPAQQPSFEPDGFANDGSQYQSFSGNERRGSNNNNQGGSYPSNQQGPRPNRPQTSIDGQVYQGRQGSPGLPAENTAYSGQPPFKSYPMVPERPNLQQGFQNQAGAYGGQTSGSRGQFSYGGDPPSSSPRPPTGNFAGYPTSQSGGRGGGSNDGNFPRGQTNTYSSDSRDQFSYGGDPPSSSPRSPTGNFAGYPTSQFGGRSGGSNDGNFPRGQTNTYSSDSRDQFSYGGDPPSSSPRPPTGNFAGYPTSQSGGRGGGSNDGNFPRGQTNTYSSGPASGQRLGSGRPEGGQIPRGSYSQEQRPRSMAYPKMSRVHDRAPVQVNDMEEVLPGVIPMPPGDIPPIVKDDPDHAITESTNNQGEEFRKISYQQPNPSQSSRQEFGPDVFPLPEPLRVNHNSVSQVLSPSYEYYEYYQDATVAESVKSDTDNSKISVQNKPDAYRLTTSTKVPLTTPRPPSSLVITQSPNDYNVVRTTHKSSYSIYYPPGYGPKLTSRDMLGVGQYYPSKMNLIQTKLPKGAGISAEIYVGGRQTKHGDGLKDNRIREAPSGSNSGDLHESVSHYEPYIVHLDSEFDPHRLPTEHPLPEEELEFLKRLQRDAESRGGDPPTLWFAKKQQKFFKRTKSSDSTTIIGRDQPDIESITDASLDVSADQFVVFDSETNFPIEEFMDNATTVQVVAPPQDLCISRVLLVQVGVLTGLFLAILLGALIAYRIARYQKLRKSNQLPLELCHYENENAVYNERLREHARNAL